MKLPHEALPPEFWDEFYKPRGPLGLFSGRTALSFVPGVSQGLDYVDTKQAAREGNVLGVLGGGVGMLTGPLGRAGNVGRQIVVGEKGMGNAGLFHKLWPRYREMMKEVNLGKKNMSQAEKDALASKYGMWPERTYDLPFNKRRSNVTAAPARGAAMEISDAWSGLSYTGTQLLRGVREGKAGEAALGEVFDHPELYQFYPELANIRVKFNPKLGSRGTTGKQPRAGAKLAEDEYGRKVYQPEDYEEVIEIGKNADHATLLHEIQHLVQEIEGFDPGFTEYAKYYDHAFAEFTDRYKHLIKDPENPPQEVIDRIKKDAARAANAVWRKNYGEQMAETVAQRHREIAAATGNDPRLMEAGYKRKRITERPGRTYSLEEEGINSLAENNYELTYSKLMDEFAKNKTFR